MTMSSRSILVSVIAGALVMPALAEQQKCPMCGHTKQKNQQKQQEKQMQQGNQQGQRQQQRQQDRLSRGSGDWELDPTGWVSVGYDYDGDGKFDAVETIYGFDLERARERSRQRNGEAQQGERMKRSGEAMTSSQRTHRIKGEITAFKQINIVGLDQPATLARIETDRGQTIPVVLGAKQRISRLDLQTGDRITIIGRPGLVDNRSVLVAKRLQTDGRTVSVSLPSVERLERLQGTVIDTRTATNRRTGDKHLIGKVQLRSGRTATVDLGPKNRVGDPNLQHGDSISLLAKPGLINGQMGLKALQFRSGGEVFDTGVASSLQRRQ